MLLNYDDQGPGPVVVFLHGFPFDRTLWKAQIKEIGAVYRVIAIDLRGHGQSAAPEGTYTMDAMADDVIELLNALQLDSPLMIAGHSMGGYVALSAVERYPERFRALILVDSKPQADTPEEAEKRLKAAAEIEETGKTDAFLDAMIPRLFAKTTLAESPKLVEKTRKLMAKTVPRAIAGALRGMAERPDRTSTITKLGYPVLILSGQDDLLSPPESGRALASQIPQGQFAVIANAGHLAPIEQPEEVSRVIHQFLNDVEGV